MSEGQNKSRVISFRISEDEYENVEKISWRHGFTSVSLFAREATLTSESSEPARFQMDIELNRLWRRIEAITITIERLTAYIGALLAPPHEEDGADDQEQGSQALGNALDTVARALGLLLAARKRLLTIPDVLTHSQQ